VVHVDLAQAAVRQGERELGHGAVPGPRRRRRVPGGPGKARQVPPAANAEPFTAAAGGGP